MPPERGATGGGGSASLVAEGWSGGSDGDVGGSSAFADEGEAGDGGGSGSDGMGGSASGVSSGGGGGDGVTPGSLTLAALLLLALLIGLRRRPSRARRPG